MNACWFDLCLVKQQVKSASCTPPEDNEQSNEEEGLDKEDKVIDKSSDLEDENAGVTRKVELTDEVEKEEDNDLAEESTSNDEEDPQEQVIDPDDNRRKVQEIIYDDPCKWPNVTDSVRVKLVERGPQTVDLEKFYFPISDDARHLSKKWFFKDLPNGESVKRQWMLYSKSQNAVFCFPCILFSKESNTGPFADIKQGFNDWKHLNPHIKLHENSEMHRKCYVEWKELEVRLRQNSSLDADFQRSINAETEKWRNLLKVVVGVVLYCAKNNLPLRGSSDSIADHNCGVFLSTLELISHYHPQLKTHIEYVNSRKNATSYFSPLIQNEVIELLGNRVRSHILKKVKSPKYFSILFYCTPDVLHSEQMSEVLRYVDFSSGECQIVESFVDFVVSHKKTGEGISEEILAKMKEDGLDINDCRGQGFDNGSNMAGIYNGVQAHIGRMNDLARFVPCAVHNLNLVGVHAAQVSPMMITFFGVIQNIFCFASGSTIRWEFINKYLDTTLKGHTDTRWSSKRQAITSVEKNLSLIHI